MGCTYSDVKYNNQDIQISSFVTPEEVTLVLDSWKVLRDDKHVGLNIFRRFFEIHPEFRKLFKKQMMEDGEELVVDEDKLRNHGNIVMEGLGAAVESLEDSVFLSNVLVSMGESHASHNVKPEMVILLWPAIRDAFNECMAEDFTSETDVAWEHIFEYMSTKFKEGLRKESRHAR